MAESFQTEIGKISAISRDLSFSHFQEMFAEFSTDESAPLRKHVESFHKITPF